MTFQVKLEMFEGPLDLLLHLIREHQLDILDIPIATITEEYLRTLALMQGGSAVSKDVPPYTVVRGANHICGLNTIGLRRAGFTAEQRLELKQLYRLLFREGRNLRAARAEGQQRFAGPAAKVLLEFLAESKRGVCSDPGGGADEET